jgi:hypothetical protein
VEALVVAVGHSDKHITAYQGHKALPLSSSAAAATVLMAAHQYSGPPAYPAMVTINASAIQAGQPAFPSAPLPPGTVINGGQQVSSPLSFSLYDYLTMLVRCWVRLLILYDLDSTCIGPARVAGVRLLEAAAVGGCGHRGHSHQEEEEEVQARRFGTSRSGRTRRRLRPRLQRSFPHCDDASAAFAGKLVQQLHAVRGHKCRGRKGKRSVKVSQSFNAGHEGF